MFCLFRDTCEWNGTDNYFSFKYFLICCVSINVISLVLPPCQARNYCHGEYSLVKDSNETALWLDYHYSDSPIIFSNPSCIDEEGKTIKRICHNGTWIPYEPPLCSRISTNEHCPDAFYEFRGYCLIKYEQDITNKTFFDEENLLNSGNSKRVTLCNQTARDFYANQLSRPRHCNSSSYVILPHDHRFHLCPDNCIAGEFGSNKCFCKVNTTTEDQKLAEIQNIQEKKLLAQLAGNDICRIDNGDPSEICDCQRVITFNFYGFTSNETNCSIIELESREFRSNSANPSPSLLLTFDDQNRKLTLFVENPKSISPSRQFSIECLTNAGFELIKTVNKHEIKNKKRAEKYAIYELKLERYIGEYWCEAFSLNLTKIQSNTVLAYKEKKGHEYTLRISIHNVKSHYDSNHDVVRLDSLQRKLSSEIHKTVGAEVRFMKVYRLDVVNGDLLLHLTMNRHVNILEEYESMQQNLKKLPDHLQILSFRPVVFCLPENTSDLQWELTRIWERKIPKELCLDENHNPVMRRCLGDFMTGAYWSELSGNCSKDIEIPVLTKFLHETLYTNISTDVMQNVTHFTYNDSLSYLDIYLYSELIKKVDVQNDENVNTVYNVFKIINNLSKKNKSELSFSQTLFNATDTLLILLEDQSKKNLSTNGSYSYLDQNILIKSVYPFRTNISGFYLMGSSDAFLDEMETVFLHRNETIEDIKMENLANLDLAVDVPEDVLKNIEADSKNPLNIQIIFKVFYQDSLFANSKQRAANKVVSVSIPGYGSYLNESLPIVMRSFESEGRCGYWDLGHKFQRRKGEWSSFGGQYSGNFLNTSDLHVCRFSHLTHFALLIVSEPIKVDEGGEEVTEVNTDQHDTDFYLNVITIIGGTLSIIGVLGIFLTAMAFSQWRQKDGTKILLNLSTAILLEIIFLQFSGINELGSNSECKLIGCLLHYTLLSKFCWMLIYALLQYRRFVKVFDAAPKKLILKSMLFGWGFAAVPVLLTLLITPESYSKAEICYLHGLPLYIAVIFPVSLVIISNLIVFIIVMYNVTSKKIESTIESNLSILQLYLAILLFFVLGIPWIFVIIAEFVRENVFKKILMYFFCATGTLQGFILFIFYVLFNAETRFRWRRYLSSRQK